MIKTELFYINLNVCLIKRLLQFFDEHAYKLYTIDCDKLYCQWLSLMFLVCSFYTKKCTYFFYNYLTTSQSFNLKE